MKFHISPALVAAAVSGAIICLPCCNKQDETTVTDIDGSVYHTIIIGSQVWMAENLKTARYTNGDTIPHISEGMAWDNLSTGAWCDINNQESNADIFGHLYNWYALNDPRGLCPDGWRVPTDKDWAELAEFLGGEELSGGKLKVADTLYWQSPNTGATNESGFSGLPGGCRRHDGPFHYFSYYGFWWTASEETPDFAFYRAIAYDNQGLFRNHYGKDYGLSVRCIKGK